MRKKKSIIQKLVVCTCVMALSLSPAGKQAGIVEITDEPATLSGTMGTLVSETDADTTVMPDKYNTGVKGDLSIVEIADTINGITFKNGESGKNNLLDFAYSNKDICGTVVFEGYDFSNYPLVAYNEDKVTRKIKLIFNNCKFSKVLKGISNENIVYEFNDCSLNYFTGSNATFSYCAFGGASSDGIVPVQNVTVNDCYFSDMNHPNYSGKEIHIDGTQIYGRTGVDAKNISFSNCRFEIPAVTISGSSSSVNACIMLQMEFSNADNIKFKNCTLNGGGYSIYARSVGTAYHLNNIVFDGINIGCAKTFGFAYPDVDSTVQLKNINVTGSLYIGSVWKDNNKTHFSVSNDTDIERKLRIYTSEGSHSFTIPACPAGNELSLVNAIDDLPTDIDIEIPENCEYAICYDETIDGNVKQIRYKNWSTQPVYLSNQIISSFTRGKGEELASGICGRNITYSLSNEGTLTLEGYGKTYDYHSQKIAPWTEYGNFITSIVVKEGIEGIGNQLFKNCMAVKSVTLPEGLLSIGSRSFSGCGCLNSLTLPESLTSCSVDAFTGTLINKVYCSEIQYDEIQISNSFIKKTVIEERNLDNQLIDSKVDTNYIITGKCGRDISFYLSDTGVLTLEGRGITYNYHSENVPPWYAYRLQINKVVVNEGIENIGNQLFRNCTKLEEISLPESIKSIGACSFISCNSLREITIPQRVTSIGKFAFTGVYLYNTKYYGTKDMWNNINVEVHNDAICKNLVLKN